MELDKMEIAPFSKRTIVDLIDEIHSERWRLHKAANFEMASAEIKFDLLSASQIDSFLFKQSSLLDALATYLRAQVNVEHEFEGYRVEAMLFSNLMRTSSYLLKLAHSLAEVVATDPAGEGIAERMWYAGIDHVSADFLTNIAAQAVADCAKVIDVCNRPDVAEYGQEFLAARTSPVVSPDTVPAWVRALEVGA